MEVHNLETNQFRAALPGLIPALRAYGRTLARNVAAADDLVQEAMLRAIKAEAQFQPGTDLRGWVFTILRNVWLGQLRRAGRERRALDTQDMTEARPPNQADRMELANLSRAMASLPVVYREALMLVGAQGMTTLQASQVCGVAEGTMKARVSRGRRALREALPDLAPEARREEAPEARREEAPETRREEAPEVRREEVPEAREAAGVSETS